MFTTNGSNIIAKYMLGQVPAYASYIAIGCGPKPLLSTDTQGNTLSKQTLDFETFRGKITSRGYVNTGSGSDIVLTAELPTDERYEITEIGLFPSQSNDAAGVADSKILLRFNQSEAWKKNGTESITPVSTNLDTILSNSITSNMAFVNSDNAGLNSSPRLDRQERPRFLNESILIRGNSTDYLLLSGTSFDLSKNAPSDTLSLATSLLSDSYSLSGGADVSVVIDFINDSGAYHRLSLSTTASDTSSSRYQVMSASISNLVSYSNAGIQPTLNNITSIKISVNVSGSGISAADFWVALDGLRVDAVSFHTAVYDLVSYKVIKNSITSNNVEVARPIVKDANSSNFIEFRFRVVT